jgi:tripartite-type tricarboxylate transporter receptor subunit TctC
MTRLSRRSLLLGAAGVAAFANNARAAGYPDHPVKITVPFAPGGPTDIMARILAKHLSERLHGSFIVENRPGAGGNIGAGAVAHAEPDGYTLLLTSSALVVNPGLYKRVPYDPYKDFAPIAELGTSPNVFLANPKAGINTLAELVAKAKAEPTALSYASPGIGTTPHLSGEKLKLDAGLKMIHVAYGGAGPAMQAVMAFTTPVACASLPPARPLIASGTLIALAVTGKTRWFDLPDVPTMLELGYKDFVTDTFQGFLAPTKTPREIVDSLAKTSLDILHDKAVADLLQADGFEVLANGPDGMKKRIDDEVPKWRDFVEKAGITPV